MYKNNPLVFVLETSISTFFYQINFFLKNFEILSLEKKDRIRSKRSTRKL